MKRTRVGRKMDSGRLAQLVSMPGIDPRVWVSLCIVDSVNIDQQHGVFADVHIMSTATLDRSGNVVAQQETVRVAPDYAGNGFGIFYPPAAGDEVLVLWPDGHPDNGGVMVKRLWSASDQPPATVVNNPKDALLMFNSDVNLRVIAQGKGNIVLQVANGQVLLGGETDQALDFVAMAQKVTTNLNNLQTHFTALEKVISGAPISEPGNGSPSALQTALAGAITASPYPSPSSVATSKVKAE